VSMLVVSHKADRNAARLADGHYSRRTPGSPQFMPPGETFVLVAEGVVFGWWRPHANNPTGHRARNGLDGWTCSIFRRVSGPPASEVILDAERHLALSGRGCGPDGLLTYVWPAKVASENPGYCFKLAGYHSAGRRHECCKHMKRWTADGKKALLHKPFELAGMTKGGPEWNHDRSTPRNGANMTSAAACTGSMGQCPCSRGQLHIGL